MVIPFLAGGFAAGAATIADYALGRPLNLWGKTIDAQQAPGVRDTIYRANFQAANVLPPPDAIMEAVRRGLVDLDVARRLLAFQGVSYTDQMFTRRLRGGHNLRLPDVDARLFGAIWEAVAKMRRSRPDPGTIAQLWAQRRARGRDYDSLKDGLDWDEIRYLSAELLRFQTPGVEQVRQLWRLRKISNAEYFTMVDRLGWYDDRSLLVSEMITPLPSVETLMRESKMHRLSDAEYARYMSALGHTDPTTRALIESDYYQAPGPSDLVRFAVREVWDQGVVDRWGYDRDMPGEFQAWMDIAGMGWGRRVAMPNGALSSHLTWPRAFWRAHWQTMSPQLAFQAYHLLRPDRIERYREMAPDVTPFTLQHLNDVLKIADYPPLMRPWLAALARSPLRLVDIRNAYKTKIRDRRWAVDQLMDRGLIREDAETSIDILDAQSADAQTKLRESVSRSVALATYKEILAGYSDGLVPRQDAIDRIRDVIGDAGLALKALALEDSRQLRQTAREILKALRADYLQGAMSLPELLARLDSIPLSKPQRDRIAGRWTALLTLQRRALTSAQVGSLVAAGALSVADGVQRLQNLSWIQPDAALLMQQAGAKYAAHQAAAAQRVAAQGSQRRKAAELAQRQAAAAQRQAQSLLRTITPLTSLKRWFQLGLRSGPWVRNRMAAMGYDTLSIDAYLSEWAVESGPALASRSLTATALQKALLRQTPLTTIKRWVQYGIQTLSWASRRLNDAGYTPESVTGYLTDWLANLPKGATGPKQEAPQAPGA